MEIIREIVRVATSHSSSGVRIFDPGIEQNAINHYLFHGFKEGQFDSDNDVAKVLFGTDANDKRFSAMKNSFTTWLINTLFHLDVHQPEFTPFQEALYQCNRRIFSAKTLASFGARHSSSWLARRVLTKSQKYHLTGNRVQALELLREQASLAGSEREFETYTEELIQALDVQRAETKSDEYLYRLYLHFSKSTPVEDAIKNSAKGYVDEVEALRKQYNTRSLTLNYFRIKSIASQIDGDYRATIKVTNEVERYFQENPRFASKTRLAEFLLLRMSCYFYLRDYKNGKANADACMVYFKKGTFNWYVFLEYYFLLAMHTGNWENASTIFREVVYHQSFRSQPISRIDKWKIFEAYLRYALEWEGKEEVLDAKTTLIGRRFSFYRFLNEVPDFEMEKRGQNIAILIVQVLFLLNREDIDVLITRARELDRYSSKHLRKEDNYRSNCFLRMIRVMVEKNFDHERAVALGEKYYKKLNHTPLSYDGEFDNLEVIPFEQLWDRVLENLKGLEMGDPVLTVDEEE